GALPDAGVGAERADGVGHLVIGAGELAVGVARAFDLLGHAEHGVFEGGEVLDHADDGQAHGGAGGEQAGAGVEQLVARFHGAVPFALAFAHGGQAAAVFVELAVGAIDLRGELALAGGELRDRQAAAFDLGAGVGLGAGEAGVVALELLDLAAGGFVLLVELAAGL